MWSQGDRVACGVITDDTKVCAKNYGILLILSLYLYYKKKSDF